MRWLVRLYPRAWRERYEDEFSALLDECGASPGVILDVILGALDARRPGLQAALEVWMRRLGVGAAAALAGLVAFAAAFIAMSQVLVWIYNAAPVARLFGGPGLVVVPVWLAWLMFLPSLAAALLLGGLTSRRLWRRLARPTAA